jgi:O-antigen/teichoic acid export membrane protein
MKDIKERTVRGGLAKICAQAANFLLRVGSLMVLARLLDPADFGLVAMVTAITGVLNIFRDFGLSAATVQRGTITDEQMSSLFWINTMAGAILGFLALAMAPVLATFYREPRLFWVTVALASGFLINAAGVQHFAFLERQMRFPALSAIEFLSQLASAIVGIGMAVGGCGYWALVGMSVTSTAAYTICVWLTTGWVPGIPSRGVEVRSMLRFGGTATLNGLVVYIAYNFEKVLLGRFWGADALGFYGRAYQLINIPTENINSSIGAVAFAALARLQDDPTRLKNYFLKGYSLVLAMTLPITIAFGLFADDIILIVLGPKWQDAAVIFRLLAPTVLIFALINPFSWLLYSVGLVGRSLKIALVIAPLVIVAYVIGLPYGPKGVAVAYSAVMTLWLVPHIMWCIHGTTVLLRDVLMAVYRPMLSGIVAGVIGFAVQFFCSEIFSPILRLLLGVCAMVGSYLLVLLYVAGQKSFYMDLLRGLRRRSLVEEKELVAT